MKVYYATTNKAKVMSLEQALTPHGIAVIHENIALDEPRSNSVYTIVSNKVRQAFEKIKKPVVALDAEFSIKALNGFPGTFVNHTLDTIGTKGLLKLMQGRKHRDCMFIQSLAYTDELMFPDLICFNALIKGIMAKKEYGNKKPWLWSRLGFIFIPEDHTKTLAEMTQEEYYYWKTNSQNEQYYTNAFANWFVKRQKQ